MLKAALFSLTFLLMFVSCRRASTSGDVESKTMHFSRDERDVVVNLVCFSGKAAELIVIDNGPRQQAPRYRNLKEALTKNQCIGGTNGGFFEGNFEPQGLMIASGDRVGSFDPKSWMKGAFVVQAGEPDLRDVGDVTDSQEATQFLQAGPWLVKTRQPETGFLNDESPRRRTFIGQGADGRWVLGACESATLHELSQVLRDARMVRIIDIESALNLDGGPSTAFFDGTGLRSKYVAEEWTVRSFLGVRVKK